MRDSSITDTWSSAIFSEFGENTAKNLQENNKHSSLLLKQHGQSGIYKINNTGVYLTFTNVHVQQAEELGKVFHNDSQTAHVQTRKQPAQQL